MSEPLAAIRVTYAADGVRVAFEVLAISVPCSSHVEISHLGCGRVEFRVFDPLPELLAALHEATAPKEEKNDAPQSDHDNKTYHRRLRSLFSVGNQTGGPPLGSATPRHGD